MDQSYITHQRRPALIPAGVELSPEDEQAVRLRTGYVNPISKHDPACFRPCFMQGKSRSMSEIALSASTACKRKAIVLDEDRGGEVA